MDRMWFGGSTKLSDVLDMGEGKGESRMISRVMTWAVGWMVVPFAEIQKTRTEKSLGLTVNS